jgi:hypothetical protein
MRKQGFEDMGCIRRDSAGKYQPGPRAILGKFGAQSTMACVAGNDAAPIK